MADVLRTILATGTLHDAVDRFVAMWIALMGAGEYHVGCAVAAAAVESRSAPDLRRAADDGFRLWQGLLVEAMTDRGIADPTASELATAILAAIEGGIILSRAAGAPGPLESVGRSLHKLIDLTTTEAGH